MTTDQAQRLRRLTREPKHDARIIAVSSGKGGVGKTSFTVNCAISLAKMGKKVIVIDADLGLSNVDILLGIIPEYSLADFIVGKKSIEEILVDGPRGIKVLSGGSGSKHLMDLETEELERMIDAFQYFNSIADYILIDTGAGIGKSVLSFVDFSEELIVLSTPDPTSITDAYALIKNAVKHRDKIVKIVINRVDSNQEGEQAFQNLKQASEKFLSCTIENLGYIFEDDNLKRSAKKQVPLVEAFPRSLASKGIESIAFHLENNNFYKKSGDGFKAFLNRLVARL